MAFTLYAATVPTFLQSLGALSGLIGKADDFCSETGRAPADLIAARLAPDMLPFAYQVKSVAAHSIGAIEGVRAGIFSPDMTPPPDSFVALRVRIAEAIAALEAIQPTEIDSFLDRDMAFVMGERRIPFTAQDFLLSFSLPNMYFHFTTAYGILRAEGLPIGKIDYLAGMRIKR